jgi:hypothetical protein
MHFDMRYLLIFFFHFLTVTSYACVCSELKEKQLIDKAEYAFIGEVISNVYLNSDTVVARLLQNEGKLRYDAWVKVSKVLKGKITDTEVLVISGLSGSCQIELIPGRRYLITGQLAPYPGEVPIDDIIEQSTEMLTLFTNSCSSRLKK